MKSVSIAIDQATVSNDGNGIIRRGISPFAAIALVMCGAGVNADSNHPFSVPNRIIGPPLRSPVNLTGTHWERTGHQHHLDPYLLYAIALVESSRIDDGFASPWPWALNKAGKAIVIGYRPLALTCFLAHSASPVPWKPELQLCYAWPPDGALSACKENG